jgi:multiple sugar transport system ATP-binding protein
MASVVFDHVTKVYGGDTQAVSDLALTVDDGEFVVLVGPSGCGKTTALRMVAGLEEITAGEVRVGGRVVNDLPPGKRDIAMVFQSFALYPHMSVFENIAFPLRSQRVSRAEIRERVERTAAMLGLTELLPRKPRTLSGGERQRTAMGRAVVRAPQAFLMDEPLSNLDAKLRVQMRQEIAELQARLGVTTIFVTHDQVEAMTMGNRIAVMRKGVLQQYGRPQAVYDAPENLFVATFMGSPGMNLLSGVITEGPDGLRCQIGRQEVAIPAVVARKVPMLAQYKGRRVAVGLRPEHVGVSSDNGGAVLEGLVSRMEPLGSEGLLHVSVEAEPVLNEAVLEAARDVDVTAVAELERGSASRGLSVVGKVDSGYVPPRTNGRITLNIAADRMQFFDMESGLAIAPGGNGAK